MTPQSILFVFGYLVCFYDRFVFVEGYRTFEHKNQTEAFCAGKHHYIINPSSTCCNFTVVEPGIKLIEHWDVCAANNSQESSSNAQQAAWGVYSCIIKNINGGDNKISLRKFGEIMSASYPEQIKSSILSEANSIGKMSADVSNSQELDKLRTTYFDIEREVCSEMPSTKKNYGHVRSCEAWEEDNHRGGRCCKGSSFPFDIGSNSYMDEDLTMKAESCRQQLQTTVLGKFAMSLSLAMESAIVDICDLSCELMETGNIDSNEVDDKNVPFHDFKSVATILSPTWLPSQTRDDAIAFAMQKFNVNNTFERMKNFEFEDSLRENGTSADVLYFEKSRFSLEFVHIPTICSAHKEILSFIELFLYTQSCDSNN